MPLRSIRGNVWGVTTAAIPVELRLEADDLPNRDTLSLSDPFAVVSSTHFGGGYVEIGRTETVWDELSPRWAAALPLQYVPGVNATALRVDVYDLDTANGEDLDKQDFLGCTFTTLADVVNSPNGSLTLPLVDRDDQGDDVKTAAAAAAAAVAAAGGSRRGSVLTSAGWRKRAAASLGTICLSVEVVHSTIQPEHALAAATAEMLSPGRSSSHHSVDSIPPLPSSSRPPIHGGGWGGGGKAAATPTGCPQPRSGLRPSSGPLVPASPMVTCKTTQPRLAAAAFDDDPAITSAPPFFSFSVAVPPVFRRGVMIARSLAAPLMVVERSRPSGTAFSVLYHTAALDREAFTATGAGHFRPVTFAAAALHNGDRHRRLRFSFYDYHMRKANLLIAQASLTYEELLAAAPGTAWPLTAAESTAMTVGTFSVMAVRRTGDRGAGGSRDRGMLPAADKKSALIDAVGDATDVKDTAELEMRIEWTGLASSSFVGGAVGGKAAATIDSDLSAATSDGSGDGGVSVASADGENSVARPPRSFSAARRASRRSAAAILGAVGGDYHTHSPIRSSLAASAVPSSPVVGAVVGPPDGAFASHAPMGADGSLSSKLRKSMALH
ncbi:hypothetical protein MMPV_001628 [Pyropia vietnamensis]